MAHKLNLPLITVSCHEDLVCIGFNRSDMSFKMMKYLWSDGPMTAAVRMGAILYLDEVVEARKDTIVAIHPLSDHRRSLLIDKLATVLEGTRSVPAGHILQSWLSIVVERVETLYTPAFCIDCF